MPPATDWSNATEVHSPDPPDFLPPHVIQIARAIRDGTCGAEGPYALHDALQEIGYGKAVLSHLVQYPDTEPPCFPQSSNQICDVISAILGLTSNCWYISSSGRGWAHSRDVCPDGLSFQQLLGK